MTLTEKALRVIELKASNPEMPNSDAYVGGGYSDQGNKDQLYSKASTFFAREDVKEHLGKLMAKVRAKAEVRVQWGFEDSLQGLIDIIKKTTSQEDYKTAIQGYKELNSMNGYNSKNINLDASITTYEDKLKEVTGEKF